MVGRSRNFWLSEPIQTPVQHVPPMDDEEIVVADVEVATSVERFSLLHQHEQETARDPNEAMHTSQKREHDDAAKVAELNRQREEEAERTRQVKARDRAEEASRVEERRLEEEEKRAIQDRYNAEAAARLELRQNQLVKQRLEQETSHTMNQPSPYSQLVLPRIIRLNFQKSKDVQDIWKNVSEFVNELDHLNPNHNFTKNQYEEIWEYCIRGSTTSGRFLVTWGFAKNLAHAQRDIDFVVQSIRETKSLEKALRRRDRRRREESSYAQVAQQQKSIQTRRSSERLQHQSAYADASQCHVQQTCFNLPTEPKEMQNQTEGGETFKGNKGTVWNKEGDIVGASAPELGVENKGRAMLENMGWSAGMSLGAENTGILNPVSVVIKLGTSGIGMDIKQRGGGQNRGGRSQWD